MNYEKIYDFRLITYFSLVMLLYVLSVQYPIVGQLIGPIAICICFLYLIIGRPEKAFLHFILNLTFSIESAFFATGQTSGVTIYSFIILPYVTIYGAFAINIILFLSLHIRRTEGKMIFNIDGRNTKIRYITSICTYILIMGFAMLLFTLLVNDNRIANQVWYGGSVSSELFRMMMLVLTIINTRSVINYNANFKYELSRWLVAMLSALSIVAIIAEIFGLHGYRMGLTNVSALPLFAFFGIGLISLIKYVKLPRESVLTIIFVASLFVLMIIKSTPLGGKWFIVVLFTMLFLMYSYTDSIKGPLMIAAVIVTLVIFVNTNFIENVFHGNDYMLIKYKEFKTFFQFAGNLNQSDASIAFRLDEIRNIWIEICKNPFYFLFGKGIVGTTLHHTSAYSWSAFGTFSEVQSNSGVYFQMHETIAVVLLKYGIVGIAGLVYMLIKAFRSVRVSPWGIIGFIWLIFFVGVYNSMLFGAVCLVLALYELEEFDNAQKERVGL